MILRQFLNTDPVAIFYLFGCGGKGAAAVVDPVGEIAPYLRAAQETGMRILSVIDTHIHADHLSAGRRLSEAAGAEYVLFAGAEAAQPFRGVRDSECSNSAMSRSGSFIRRGHARAHFLARHRLDALRRAVVRADRPHPMVGDLGRTGLATTAEEGARALFRSVQRLKALPDYVEVFPGAFSGSVCGRRLSGKPASTIGFERRHNEAFGIDDEDAFVQFMLAEVPPPPPGAAEIRAANSGNVKIDAW
jgi:hydroxyacylglutathione hydrolase